MEYKQVKGVLKNFSYIILHHKVGLIYEAEEHEGVRRHWAIIDRFICIANLDQ